ncbi:class I SAM-dependent methyltransferase [Dactylosporangium roseum]|uniref:Class I SAM-dependent methyltransferase n=1 Tax=Dactylosporangium roseum TaxID=47989 RepID=A0ABY5YYE8_9ACTN|nr:class I SAM-dependent methyltransferase [Dactylosporangium roseum]UWZ34766.1 class I SAM-dependent methyltransferase [Dactylosporangium roseum]
MKLSSEAPTAVTRNDAQPTGDAAPWDALAGRERPDPLDGARLAAGWQRRETFSARILARCIQSMGAFTTPGEVRPAGDLATVLAIDPVHARLWRTLLDIVVADGLLERDGDLLRATDSLARIADADLDAEAELLVTEHPELAAQLRLLRTCVNEYPRLLRGEIQPIGVMFPSSSMEMVASTYRGDPFSDRLNELVAEAVAAHVDADGDRTALRVLEVGAGTGGTTAHVLAALKPYGDRVAYTYTDISPSFLRHGRRQFQADHPGMEFKRLDIESDPGGQRFEQGGYDAVIAANVLHATRNLRDTLAHVDYLIAGGGRMVLLETTSFLRFLTMTFGLLDGWWRAEDREVRLPGAPLADVATWERLLHEIGFRPTAALAATDFGRDERHVLIGERSR